MGDLQSWSPEPNGALTEERAIPPSSSSSSSSSCSSSNPNPSSISAEIWAKAEQTTQEIICKVQPTVVSEERRKGVIDYVQRLLRDSIKCEVFPFGSVPLKTYLPDGDIDLTAFGGLDVEDALANNVCSILEGEDQNRAAEFVVKDVQLIRAEGVLMSKTLSGVLDKAPSLQPNSQVILSSFEGCFLIKPLNLRPHIALSNPIVGLVKLVKCLVQNIVVDISFNQLGGLCTLCFLEKVDRLIGKDNLFKRSIILIKAWCYYESRILGAHHGLISTYALETLVLYIFHLFHSSLSGPLAVLYTFLDYFSKFDWDNDCISLNGPVRISSLPEIVAETPENGGGNLLLSNDFLRDCVDMFSVPSRALDTNSRTFPKKHLNIVDPLKEINNLGRSVSKGNFYRIRSAFTYGARKLGRILSQPEENIADELSKFFTNTLDRHGSGERPDVQDPVPMSCPSGFGPSSSFSGIKSCQEEKKVRELKSADSSGLTGECRLDPEGLSHDGVNNVKISGTEMKISRFLIEPQEGSMKVVPSTMLSESDNSANGTAVSGYRFSGDAKDLATSRIQGLKISNDTPKSSLPSVEESISPLGKVYHAPHLYFSSSFIGNEKMRNGNPDRKQPENYGFTDNEVSSGLLQAPDEETGIIVGRDESQLVTNHEVLTSVESKDGSSILNPVACSSEDLHPAYGERASAGTVGSPEALNSLSNLSGDYDSQFNSLQYGWWCYENTLCVPALPMPPPLPSQFQSNNSWDAIGRSAQFRRNGFSHVNANGAVPGPAFYTTNPLIIPGGAFGVEEMPKARGTGTYFPNMSHYSNRDRLSTARGRNQAPVRSPRNNGRAVTPPEANLLERRSREPPQAHVPIHQGGGKPGSLDFHQSSSPTGKLYPNVNGLMPPSERGVEFGSFGHPPLGATLLESSRQPNPGSSLTQNSSLSLPTSGMQRPNLVLGMNQDRVAVRSYHLKDEDDFPPLSV